jgi:imidazoleglycerol phosphate synthase glutamine amidotransferase subunit HisH
MMDYEMFKRGINAKEFNENLMQKVLYGSDVVEDDNNISIQFHKEKEDNADEQN